MKQLTIIIFTLLMGLGLQAQGIEFFKGSFDEAKAEAKKTE